MCLYGFSSKCLKQGTIFKALDSFKSKDNELIFWTINQWLRLILRHWWFLRSDSSQKEKKTGKKKAVGTNAKGPDNLRYADHKGCHWPCDRWIINVSAIKLCRHKCLYTSEFHMWVFALEQVVYSHRKTRTSVTPIHPAFSKVKDRHWIFAIHIQSDSALWIISKQKKWGKIYQTNYLLQMLCCFFDFCMYLYWLFHTHR